MRRRLIWLAIVLPAGFYLLTFLAEGLPPYRGADPPPPGSPAGQRALYAFKTQLPRLETSVSRGITILVAMAVGLGVINLCRTHGGTLLHGRPGWKMSLLVFASFLLVFGAMLWQYRLDARRRALEDETGRAWQRLAAAQRLSDVRARDAALAQLTPADWEAVHRRRDWQDEYRFEPRVFFVSHVKIPLEATVMSLLGFYLTYAAYRAFRLRSLDATVMMLSAAVVILGSDAFGGWLTGGTLTRWAEFDNGVLNSGMQRGLWLGIGVAIIAVGLRMLLGLERGVVDVPTEDRG